DPPQFRDACIEPPELKQAMGEIKPRAQMVLTELQHLAELVNSELELALDHQGRAEAVQRAGMVGSEHQCARERQLGIRGIGFADIDAAELDRELCHCWRELDTLLEHSFGFVVPTQAAK